jgi:hypothetical protein
MKMKAPSFLHLIMASPVPNFRSIKISPFPSYLGFCYTPLSYFERLNLFQSIEIGHTHLIPVFFHLTPMSYYLFIFISC